MGYILGGRRDKGGDRLLLVGVLGSSSVSGYVGLTDLTMEGDEHSLDILSCNWHICYTAVLSN